MKQLDSAIELCTLLYDVLKPLNIYPALTGGTLYKEGERKDIDIVLYRGESGKPLDIQTVWDTITPLEVFIQSNYLRVAKCTWRGNDLDIIFPEALGHYGETPEHNNGEVPSELGKLPFPL